MKNRVLKFFALILLVTSTGYYTNILLQDFKVSQINRNLNKSPKAIMELFEKYQYYPPLEELLIKSYKESIFGCTELQSMSRDLIKLNPRSTQAHFILSACYDSTGDLLSAIKYINQSLEFDPNNTSVLLNLAIVQLKLGELDASQKTLDKVSEINPFTENLRVIQSELNSRKTQ